MAILQKLKSLLGLGGSEANRRSRDVAVTVERERSREDEDDGTDASGVAGDEPAASTPGAETPSADTEAVDAGDRTPAADAETGAETPSTGGPAVEDAPTVADDGIVEGDDGDAGEAETVGDEKPVTEAEPDADEARIGAADETRTDDGDDAGADDSAPVDEIKGIGPAYADRLADAGVETVNELAAADPDELAESTDISPKRLQDWIDRANAR